MALKTNCLTDGCVYHTHIESNSDPYPSHIEVVVDIPSTLALTSEQAEEVETLLHNQVELVIAYALQKSRENKDEASNTKK